MGQTLPHGVYLPDNGERNCYTGLSQNWQKLDNLLGNKGDKVSFAQTLTEGVEIGKITINGVDIAMYHTDYSHKADADNVYTKAEVDASLSAKADKATTLSGYGITDAYTKVQVENKISELVNSAPETLDTLNELASALGNDPNFATTVANQIGTKANDSDVVHKSGDETIGGNKRFNLSSSVDPFVNTPIDSDSYITLCGGYSWSDGGTVALFSKNHANRGAVRLKATDGTNVTVIRITSNGNFYPELNNAVNLGTSTNKWKTINGINPGALSLPDYAQSVILSFAIDSPISIPFNGFIKIWSNVTNYTYFIISVNGEEIYVGQSAQMPTLGAFIPVSQNDIVNIHVADGEYGGYGMLVLYKNKGNV